MRNSNVLPLVLVAILTATSIVSWRAWQKERARADSLQARIELEERQPEAIMPEPAAVAAVTDALPASDKPMDSREEDDWYIYQRRLLQDTSYREARRRFRQLELADGHIDIRKVLGISQEKADRLFALLAEQELRWEISSPRNPRNEKELQARRLENERLRLESDAEIAAVIGELNLEKWHDYQASLPFRHQVRELRFELSGGANELREDQVEPLVHAMYIERKRAREELTEFTAGLVWSGGMEAKSHQYRNARQLELDRAADERIRAAAGRILSPDQLATLDDMIRRDRALQNARFEQHRAAGKAASLSGGAN